MKEQSYISLFGVPVLNLTMDQAVERVDQSVRDKAKAQMFFVNAYCLNIARTDKQYHSILSAAHSVFGDGVGVRIASRIAGTPIAANVNGTDMMRPLCEICERREYSMFLLGAKPGVAERMRDRLIKEYRELRIAGCHHGYFDRSRESRSIVDMVNRSGADILLVAFGVPEQEKWIHQNAEVLQCPVCMGVGGLFDFFSGDIPRAPAWMRRSGIEWLFRFLCEPRRLWRRYILGNPLFLWRVLEGRFTNRL